MNTRRRVNTVTALAAFVPYASAAYSTRNSNINHRMRDYEQRGFAM